MEVETKFRRLFRPVALGERIDDWRVCWVGGWDKYRVLFVVMVERRKPTPGSDPPGGGLLSRRNCLATKRPDIW
jgi:hypothetical protein